MHPKTPVTARCHCLGLTLPVTCRTTVRPLPPLPCIGAPALTISKRASAC